MARPERLELPTLWFEARCSIQLSYGRVAYDTNLHCFILPAEAAGCPQFFKELLDWFTRLDLTK